MEPLKKFMFGAPFWGVLMRDTQKISRDKISFAAQQLYAKIKILMFCGLEEERTRFRKEKKIYCGQKWVVRND